MVNLRELGRNTGTLLNPLGLGCMSMSDFYGALSERNNDEESIAVLNRAIDLGCTFWDTSDIYGMGANERLLGKFFASEGKRDQVFLCTKFGVLRNERGDLLGYSGKPEYVRQACEASLKRLGIDTIDLYYMHRMDPYTPIEETVKALAELVKEGKIRYIGLSEMSADILHRAHKVHPIAAVQMEYSPWTLYIETNGVLAAARELDVSIVCYSPLGRGFLTGALKSPDDLSADDLRRRQSRFLPENFSKNLDLVGKIQSIAARKKVSASELVLAWVLSQGQDFFVIPGTKRLKYLEQNVQGGQLELSSDEVAEIRTIVDTAAISGGRY
ncbi:NADP-dependent oxidoreductase domain-containing protein [Fennellomyces sp. T-0311]|nr:NADP-dependent oxidoreductase domain-containing protein [Fennellomyces sp. T-0311]